MVTNWQKYATGTLYQYFILCIFILLYRVDKDMHVNCELQAFNSIVIKQVAASLEEEASHI